jgi:plasmid stability protein
MDCDINHNPGNYQGFKLVRNMSVRNIPELIYAQLKQCAEIDGASAETLARRFIKQGVTTMLIDEKARWPHIASMSMREVETFIQRAYLRFRDLNRPANPQDFGDFRNVLLEVLQDMTREDIPND